MLSINLLVFCDISRIFEDDQTAVPGTSAKTPMLLKIECAIAHSIFKFVVQQTRSSSDFPSLNTNKDCMDLILTMVYCRNQAALRR
uniref:Uncharacterized protein n=1 Tax=Pararge aegeria TaxID=116150 RepID=S4PXX7_9NEOP